MRLSKTAFQTYRLLPDEVKANYSATVSALRSKFKPVDIEELRRVEFHQLVQKNQSVEQLGLQLQKVAKRAFPTLVGKDLDRLMKGRFFQALLPKWQRKLGAPKTEESFDELFNRARTMEFREQQYNEIADERRGKDKPRKVDGETTRGKGSDSRSNTSCEGSDSSGPKPTSDRPANRLGLQHIKCRACGQYGHFARNCGQKRRQGAESPGIQGSGETAKRTDAHVLGCCLPLTTKPYVVLAFPHSSAWSQWTVRVTPLYLCRIIMGIV